MQDNAGQHLLALEGRVGTLREMLDTKANTEAVNECLLLKANKSEVHSFKASVHSHQTTHFASLEALTAKIEQAQGQQLDQVG